MCPNKVVSTLNPAPQPMSKAERLKVLRGIHQANKKKTPRYWQLLASALNSWNELEVKFIEVRSGLVKEYVYNEGEHNFIFDDLRLLNEAGV